LNVPLPLYCCPVLRALVSVYTPPPTVRVAAFDAACLITTRGAHLLWRGSPASHVDARLPAHLHCLDSTWTASPRLRISIRCRLLRTYTVATPPFAGFMPFPDVIYPTWMIRRSRILHRSYPLRSILSTFYHASRCYASTFLPLVHLLLQGAPRVTCLTGWERLPGRFLLCAFSTSAPVAFASLACGDTGAGLRALLIFSYCSWIPAPPLRAPAFIGSIPFRCGLYRDSVLRSFCLFSWFACLYLLVVGRDAALRFRLTACSLPERFTCSVIGCSYHAFRGRRGWTIMDDILFTCCIPNNSYFHMPLDWISLPRALRLLSGRPYVATVLSHFLSYEQYHRALLPHLRAAACCRMFVCSRDWTPGSPLGAQPSY